MSLIENIKDIKLNKQQSLKTVKDLKPGQKGVVVKLGGLGKLRSRIIDMGIIPGTAILMKRVAPFGDPIQISVRGYELSIRKTEAQKIYIDKIGGQKS